MIDDQMLLEHLAATDVVAPETPMPKEAWTRDVALAEIERRVGMQTRDRTEQRLPQPRRSRGWLVAAAAFVAVLVIGSAMLLLFGGSSGPEVVDEPTTTITTTTIPTSTTAAPSSLSLPATWQRVGAPVMDPAVGLFDMTLTESGLVAVGFDPGNEDYRQNGAIFKSADGVTWTRLAEDAPELNLGAILIYGVTDGGPGIVAVGMGCEDDADACMPYPTVWTSDDGTVWTRSAADPDVFGEWGAMMDVISSELGIIAAGGSYDESDPESLLARPTVWLSADGIDWERAWSGETFGAADSSGVPGFHALTGSLDGPVVGVGMAPNTQGDLVAAVWASTDGRAWQRVEPDSAAFASNTAGEVAMHDVAWGPAGFVAVGTDGGASVAIWHSPDGLTWTRADTANQTFESIGTLSAVDALGKGWIAAGPQGFADMTGGTVTLWTSPDGLSWDRVHSIDPGYAMSIVETEDGIAVAGGMQGTDNFHAAVWAGPAFDPLAPPPDPGPAPSPVQEETIPVPDEGLSCEELAEFGYGYAATVAYWVQYGKLTEFDPDGNGMPCEGAFAAANVSDVYGGPDALSVHIVTTLDQAEGTFVASGDAVESGLICSTGTTEFTDDASPDPNALFRWEDRYTCDDGSGTFVVGADVFFVAGNREYGVWSIESGAGSYEWLRAGGDSDTLTDLSDALTGRVWLTAEEN